MNTNGAKRNLNSTSSPTAGGTAIATANKKTHLLYHLLKEALYARNRELDKLHRIHDLMLQLQSREINASEVQNNGTSIEVGALQPHPRQKLHSGRYRYLPSVEPNSLAALELKTILHVLLERIHFFVPYRAALVRLGDGTKTRPLETVAWRVCDNGSGDNCPEQRYELLADAALKWRSDVPIGKVQHKECAASAAFLAKGAIHYHLTIPSLADRRMMGLFSIFLEANTSLGRWKIKLLNALAGQTSKVIHSSLAYEDIKNHITERDQGRYNELLQNLVNDSGRVQSPLNRKQIREFREKQLEEHWCN
jgi:hypothetical protein